MIRRDFLGRVVAGTAAGVSVLRGGGAALGAEPASVEELTIAAAQAAMQAGTLTAESLTSAYLARIEAMDHKGPALHSMIELNGEALRIAAALDAERKAKGARGPLHGIPMVLKDNIDTHDTLTTTAGSLALEGSIAPRDSSVAARLRAAGVVFLGKANMSEWANIRSSQSTSGWSARGGQCKNPYDPARNPCGSSSGTGAAVGANLALCGIGTETDGSVVCPSNANALVGIKPTVGLVSRAGIIPISHTQDTAGPMTRTVHDAALLLSVLAGADPRDAATAAAQGHAAADYTKFLVPDGLKGARIGVARQFLGFNREVDRLFEEALGALKKAGALLVDPTEIAHTSEYSETEVLLYELKADLAAYLATLGPGARVKSLQDVIDFNEANKDKEMSCFGQETFLDAQKKGPLTDKVYLDALAKNTRLSRAEGLDRSLDKDKLDAIVAPTGGPAWLTDCIVGDHFGGGSSSPAAVAGYPNITVPSGYVAGLPIGISFMGRAWSEPVLLRIAFGYEQATRWRKPPSVRG
jgi:amidase